MNEQFFNRLEDELNIRRNKNLFRDIQLYSECRINLCSNDYFQLRHDSRVIIGAKKACDKFGTGSGASPLLSGFLPCHESFLEQLKKWKQKSFGMLFNAGFLANQAVLNSLPKKNDLVLADKLIHHSMVQALAKGAASFKRYHHLDLTHLEALLNANYMNYETVFVVTESVFSMDGDYPDLKKLVELKQRYPFILILDEAHGTGVFGKTGAGLAEEMQVQDQVDIIIGTLGKSLASMGAYVLSNSSTIIDYLVNHAGEFIYSTFLSPSQVGSAEVAMKILQSSQDEREYLQSISKNFRKILNQKNQEVNIFSSPIIPVFIDNPAKVLEVKNSLLQEGIIVGAIRPPTVPNNMSRLRISLHTGVTQKNIEKLNKTLSPWITSQL